MGNGDRKKEKKEIIFERHRKRRVDATYDLGGLHEKIGQAPKAEDIKWRRVINDKWMSPKPTACQISSAIPRC